MADPRLRVARRPSITDGRMASATLAGAAGLAAVAAAALVFGGDALPAWAAPVTLAVAAVALGTLAWLRHRAEREDDRVRRALASGLAHALRTPLAQVRMRAEMILAGRTPSPAEQERAVMDIEGAARRLSRAVENVVAFTSLSRPGLLLMPSPVDLGALVEDAVADAGEASRSRGVTLDADPPAGLTVTADANAVRLALDNLIDNALQHAEAGHRVTVSLAGSGDRAVLSITDQGPGVHERERGRIWRPYARLSRRGEPDRHSGLGLAIVRAVARGHGGDAWVETAPNGGARFCIALPAPAQPAPAIARPALAL